MPGTAAPNMMTLPRNTTSANWYAYTFLLLCVAVVGWCAYPARLYFLNDDFIHIPMAYDGTVGHHNGLRYVCDFSLYIDSLFWKENATGYHGTNLLLYIANLLLALPLLHRVAASLGHPVSRPTVVAMVSLFAVYAFHSEALFWILCRTASLSFFFNLLSWHCFFLALRQRWWAVPMVLFFLLGIFTYESLWVYPPWLLLWYWLLPRGCGLRRRSVGPIALIWLVFLAYFPYRLAQQGELLGTYEAADIQEFRLLPVVVKSAKLFARSFLPPVEQPVLFVAMSVAVVVALVAFAYIIWKSKRTNRLLLFLVAAWLVAYIPYVALGISTNGYESERYLYYPSFFLCAAGVYAVVVVWRHQPLLRNAVLAFCFAYHLFFLVVAALSYQTISRYARQGIEAVQNVPAGKRLVVRNLPVYSYGLPVYNYGFEKAVAWLAPQVDTARMQIEGRTNFFKQEIQLRKTSSATADTLIFEGR